MSRSADIWVALRAGTICRNRAWRSAWKAAIAGSGSPRGGPAARAVPGYRRNWARPAAWAPRRAAPRPDAAGTSTAYRGSPSTSASNCRQPAARVPRRPAADAAGDAPRAGHPARRGPRTRFLRARPARARPGRRRATTRSRSRGAPGPNTVSVPRQMRDKDRVVRLARMIGARVQLRPGGVHDLSHPVESEPGADGGAHLVPAVRGRRPVEVDPRLRPADRRGKRPDDLRAGADGELDVARADPAAQGGRRRVAGPGRDGDARGQPQLGSSLGREVAGRRSGRGQQGRQQAGLQAESADHLKVPAVIHHVVEQRG